MVIVIILSASLVAGALYVGFRYAGIEDRKGKSNTLYPLNKQAIVKARREEFGASNRGTSMDDAQIFDVPYSYLGITE